MVRYGSPWNTFDDFKDALKKNPGKYKYGSVGPRTASHLDVSLILKEVGPPLTAAVFVYSNSAGEAVLPVIQGEVNLFQANLAPMDSHVKGNIVEGLAVSTEERLADPKDVPTYKELGHSNMDVIGWRGVCSPPGISAEIISVWEKAVEETCNLK